MRHAIQLLRVSLLLAHRMCSRPALGLGGLALSGAQRLRLTRLVRVPLLGLFDWLHGVGLVLNVPILCLGLGGHAAHLPLQRVVLQCLLVLVELEVLL